MLTSSSLSVCSHITPCPSNLLPSSYELLTVLGIYGEALKCFKCDTKETVAVNIPLHQGSIGNELNMLNYIMSKNLDKCNIVRFVDSFRLRNNKTALAFEMLDMTLFDYIVYHRQGTPLDLQDVRSVVQQLATALQALKTIQVIHSDIKLDNIMLVDHEVQPLRVKLIDFGVAFRTYAVKQGENHQPKQFRAPEILLGLPFSEAIDMWSLGIVMACTMFGLSFFPEHAEHDPMQYIVELLGVPPDQLLRAGMHSKNWFVEDSAGHWRLKTPGKLWKGSSCLDDRRNYNFRSLDDLETLPLKNLNKVNADEKKECFDLLKAMLQMDPNERITPSQVLSHPFITRGTVHQSCDTNQTLETPSTLPPGVIFVQPPQTACDLALEGEKQVQHARFIICKTFEIPSRGVPFLQPVQGTCSLVLEGQKESKDESDSICETFESPCSGVTSGSYALLSAPSLQGVLVVQPAPAECCLRLDKDSKQTEVCPLSRPEDVSKNTEVESLPLLIEDFDVEQEHTELTATTSDDIEPEKKKRKKKNCFRRFFAWAKKTFCCCIRVVDEED